MEILAYILQLGLVFLLLMLGGMGEFIPFKWARIYRMGHLLFSDPGPSIKHKENGQTHFLSS